jgi:hypothetical protein
MRRYDLVGAACVLAATVSFHGGGAAEPAAGRQAEHQRAFDVESARRMLAELGARQTAEHVSSDPAMLESVAAGVASARREWLDVGARLVAGADTYAYLKDRLVQAFSYALQHDAPAVLERAASGVPIETVCRYDPFFGADTPPTRAELDRALAARERVVAGVSRADLVHARDACLAALRRLRAAGGEQR